MAKEVERHRRIQSTYSSIRSSPTTVRILSTTDRTRTRGVNLDRRRARAITSMVPCNALRSREAARIPATGRRIPELQSPAPSSAKNAPSRPSRR